MDASTAPLSAHAAPDSGEAKSHAPALLPSIDRIPELDGLRGLAALAVMLAHVPISAFTQRIPFGREYLGFASVDVFFALSGFLITRILLQEKRDGAPLRYFLMRRFLRLLPAYYLVLAVVWFTDHLPEVWWAAVYLTNYYFAFDKSNPSPLGHTWSLCVEEHFYLVWPLVVYSLSRVWSLRVAMFVFIPLTIVSTVWLILKFREPETTWGPVYRWTTCRTASLAIGSIWAYYELWIRAHKNTALKLAAMIAIGGVSVLVIRRVAISDDWRILAQVIMFSSFSGAAVLSVVATTRSTSPIPRLLRAKWLSFVGRISYGLYLYHAVIYHYFGLTGDLDPTTARIRTLMAVVTTFAVAILSFAYFEGPILKLQNKFRQKKH